MDEQLHALADAVRAHVKRKEDFRARLALDPEAAALFNMIFAGFMSAHSGPAEAALSAAAEIDQALIAPKAAEVARLRERLRLIGRLAGADAVS